MKKSLNGSIVLPEINFLGKRNFKSSLNDMANPFNFERNTEKLLSKGERKREEDRLTMIRQRLNYYRD